MLSQDIMKWFNRSHEKARATKSILSPLQWVLAIIAAPCTAMMIFGSPLIQAAGLAIFAITIIYIGVVYGLFARFDRDRLHTEEHRENIIMLNQPYQDSRGVIIDSTAANTAAPQIEAANATPAPTNPSTLPSDNRR